MKEATIGMKKQKVKGRPNLIDVLVGEKLKAIREEKKVTQNTLALAVGVTFQQIQKYENGKNRMSASRLYMIAYALSIPISSLFSEETEQQVKQLAKIIA